MIAACIATIPGREESLINTIGSLYNQVDKVYVILNGHKSVPKGIRNFKRVHIMKEKKNMGDAMKFGFYGDGNGRRADTWFFCDDDLIYPSNYVFMSLKHLEKKPEAILSYHGRVLPPRPVKSYYADRIRAYRCLDDVNRYHEIKKDGTLGTGVMFFRAGAIQLDLTWFTKTNMADIWLAKFAAQQNVKTIICPHHKGWIKYQEQPPGSTIFDQHYFRDKDQTEIYNSI